MYTINQLYIIITILGLQDTKPQECNCQPRAVLQYYVAVLCLTLTRFTQSIKAQLTGMVWAQISTTSTIFLPTSNEVLHTVTALGATRLKALKFSIPSSISPFPPQALLILPCCFPNRCSLPSSPKTHDSVCNIGNAIDHYYLLACGLLQLYLSTYNYVCWPLLSNQSFYRQIVGCRMGWVQVIIGQPSDERGSWVNKIVARH